MTGKAGQCCLVSVAAALCGSLPAAAEPAGDEQTAVEMTHVVYQNPKREEGAREVRFRVYRKMTDGDLVIETFPSGRDENVFLQVFGPEAYQQLFAATSGSPIKSLGDDSPAHHNPTPPPPPVLQTTPGCGKWG